MSQKSYSSETMTDKEFESAVRGMRAAQIRYFAAPRDSDDKKQALVQARTLEARVDRELKRRTEQHQTPSLFDEEMANV